MKKALLLFLVLHFSLFTIRAQRWDSLGNGLKPSNDTWGLNVYNGELIAGGYFDTAGRQPASGIAAWNGSSWSALGTGVTGAGTCSFASPLTIYNGNLIVGGTFSTAGSIPATNIAVWNGSSWSNPFGSGLVGFAGCGIGINYVAAAIVYKGNLIVAGNFFSAGGIPVNNIAQWNGTSWDSLGSGVTGEGQYQHPVQVLDTFQGNLIVGGYFDTAGGQPAEHIASWNGTTWTPLGSGCYRRGDAFSGVYALAEYNGKLIAGGEFDSAGGQLTKYIAQWDGSSWSNPFGPGMNNDVWALTVYRGKLVAIGGFNLAGGIPASEIASWNGSTWSALGTGITSGWGPGLALTEYNKLLIASGYFGTVGGINVNNIASWCDTCPALSVNEIETLINTTKIYPNPNNGVFALSLPSPSGEGASYVEIYNMLGGKVYDATLPQTPKGALKTIDLSSQPSGVYLYRVITETGNLVSGGKLIIL